MVLRLLRAQRLHRVEARGLGCWISAEKQTDTKGDDEAAEHRPELNDGRQRRNHGNDFGRDNSHQHADGTADNSNRRRLDQKLKQDIVAARAERFANADFASSLGHADEHDVHDDDPADDKRNRGDTDHYDEKSRANVFPEGEKGIAGLYGEIVFRVIGNVAAAAHNLADLVDAFLNFVRRARTGSDAQRIILRAEIFLIGAERENDPVVKRSAKGCPLFFSHADDLALKIVPPDFFAHRVYAGKKILNDVHADCADGSRCGKVRVSDVAAFDKVDV